LKEVCSKAENQPPGNPDCWLF